jgi:hypothetical protein
MQEYIINAARAAGHWVSYIWIIHMQKESHIVSKSGAECRWTSPHTQVGALVHTGVIYVRGASRGIAAKRRNSNSIGIKCRQSTKSTLIGAESGQPEENVIK